MHKYEVSKKIKIHFIPRAFIALFGIRTKVSSNMYFSVYKYKMCEPKITGILLLARRHHTRISDVILLIAASALWTSIYVDIFQPKNNYTHLTEMEYV